jgi:Flp pilus assembly CpaF family ATPase
VSGDLAAAIRELVAEDLAAPEAARLLGDDRREFARQQIYVHLDYLAGGLGDGPLPSGTPDEEERLAKTVLDALFGMGRLQALIDDSGIENIDINGCDRVWATFADGSKRMMPAVAASDDELIDMVRSAASRFGLSERRFDLARPELDLRLPDGSRLSAVMAVTERPAVSIRRHRFTDLSLDDLVELGTVDGELASLLAAAVRSRKNIVVSGAMNSGKTTLLRALAAEIPARERIVTIEQAFELGLDTAVTRHPDMVALEARPANVEGEGLVSVADLVRRALRMNADRVIVGEVLGDEVLPMLNAMSQGRSGSMCTIHADSSSSVFRRIASYAVQSPERIPIEASNLLVAGAVHFVVHLDSELHDGQIAARGLGAGAGWGPEASDDGGWSQPVTRPLGPPGDFPPSSSRQRFVSSIREVVDAEGTQVVSNEVFRPGRGRRAVPASPLRAETLRELVEFGYEPSGSGLFDVLA